MEQNNSMHSKDAFTPQDNSRRAFVLKGATGLVLAAGALTIPFHRKQIEGNIKAVAFDGFAIFDPRPFLC